eukprot:TRINITY_DN61547_c0_g1_i1.p1 TRINITY_DN61547_c0_g1~~TRINITY_DN61547_c0_g1_i1.p1  ORF type:complete len:163 (+),score=20.24 TRINITY_DN61547_c0_g1_i1:58-546(+)
MANDDGHELRRYTEQQCGNGFASALSEIRAGRKRSHWMWYIVPTPPFIVNGVEVGSKTNQHYALRSDDQARGFLAFEADGVNLRNNYLEIMNEIASQLQSGISPVMLLGEADVPKLNASAQYFQRIARGVGDEEVADVCTKVLRLSPHGSTRSIHGCSCVTC